MNTIPCSRVLILADDLSGAADCAVTGSRLGLRSHVMLHAPSAVHTASDTRQPADVLAIDLDSRRQSPAVAALIHTTAWRSLGHRDIRVYKKVDSTLRGNVASEIAALAREIGMAIVAPAFPSAGRTTVGAQQLLHGVALEDTEVWKNEQIPGRADLLEMMSSVGLNAATLSLDSVRAGPGELTRQLIALQCSGAQAVICDAQTDDDLHRIAAASHGLANVFWAGSAGLARAWMPHVSQTELREPNAFENGHAHRTLPILTVVGSMSSISHAQIASLRADAGAAMLALEIDPQLLLDDATANASDTALAPQSSAAATQTESIGARIKQALEAGRDVLVSLSQQDRTRVADGLLLCEALARLVAPMIPLAGTLIATGGETARALLTVSGVHALQIFEEIEDGVPLMYASAPHDSASGKHLQVITKAGGFGTPQTLVTAWRRASMSTTDTQSEDAGAHTHTHTNTQPDTPNALSPSFSGPRPASGAEDQPFHEELTQ